MRLHTCALHGKCKTPALVIANNWWISCPCHASVWETLLHLGRLLCGVPASAEDGWIANCGCNSSSLEPVWLKNFLEVGYQPVAKCQIPHTETCPHLSKSSTSTSLLETWDFSHDWVAPGSAAPLKVSFDRCLPHWFKDNVVPQAMHTHENGFCTQKWWPRSRGGTKKKKREGVKHHLWQGTSGPLRQCYSYSLWAVGLLNGAGQSTGLVQWTMSELLSTIFIFASTTDSAHTAMCLAKVDFHD